MTREQELDRLLNMVGENVDRAHLQAVDERYRKSLACQVVDAPPLVVGVAYPNHFDLPSPWDEFRRYSYREAFNDPAAMLQNQILSVVVPSLLIKDDNPLAVRNDHGTIQMASLLGGRWEVPENDFPWVRRFDSVSRIREIAESVSSVDLGGGILPRSFKTLEFYSARLREHPGCQGAIEVTMPDLQGPLDTAEQLWGSDIYYAFTDEPELVTRLLARVTDAMLVVFEAFHKYSTERLEPYASAQHGYVIPGRILIRNDSSIMLSASAYGDMVRPHDARVLRGVSGGSIHFCGSGGQLIDPMLDIPDLRGIDVTQPHLNDIMSIYAKCRARNVALTGLVASRKELMSGAAVARFPTGCILQYSATGLDDALEVVRAYRR